MEFKVIDKDFLQSQYLYLSEKVNALYRESRTADTDRLIEINAQVSVLNLKKLSLKQRIDNYKPSLGIPEGSIIQ